MILILQDFGKKQINIPFQNFNNTNNFYFLRYLYNKGVTPKTDFSLRVKNDLPSFEKQTASP